jgi:hypothetical protein
MLARSQAREEGAEDDSLRLRSSPLFSVRFYSRVLASSFAVRFALSPAEYHVVEPTTLSVLSTPCAMEHPRIIHGRKPIPSHSTNRFVLWHTLQALVVRGRRHWPRRAKRNRDEPHTRRAAEVRHPSLRHGVT